MYNTETWNMYSTEVQDQLFTFADILCLFVFLHEE